MSYEDDEAPPVWIYKVPLDELIKEVPKVCFTVSEGWGYTMMRGGSVVLLVPKEKSKELPRYIQLDSIKEGDTLPRTFDEPLEFAYVHDH